MITVDRREFLASLRRAAKVAPRNTSIPYLRNALLTITPDSVTIRATDLEQSLAEVIPATGDTRRVSLCLPVQQLLSVLVALPQHVQDVPIEAHPQCLFIGTTKLPIGCPVEDYPAIPSMPNHVLAMVELPEDFSEHFKFVRAASTQGDVRNSLNGVCFDFQNGNIAASDGKRLHCAQVWTPADIQSVILSPHAFDLVIPTTVVIPNPEKDSIGNVFLLTENGYLATRLVEGKFPDYHSLVPKDHPTTMLVDRAELVNVMEQCLPAVSAQQPSCVLNLNHHFEVHAENDGAAFTNGVSARIAGPALKINLNPHNLLGALKLMHGETVTFTFRKADSVVYMVSEDEREWALIMPLGGKK